MRDSMRRFLLTGILVLLAGSQALGQQDLFRPVPDTASVRRDPQEQPKGTRQIQITDDRTRTRFDRFLDHVEGETRIGCLVSDEYVRPDGFLLLSGVVRYRLPKAPLAFSVEGNLGLSMDNLRAVGEAQRNEDEAEVRRLMRQEQRLQEVAAFADWVLLDKRLLSPFIGIGIGHGSYRADAEAPVLGEFVGRKQSYSTLVPRIGLEISDHLRVTFETRFTSRRAYAYSLTVSLRIARDPDDPR